LPNIRTLLKPFTDVELLDAVNATLAEARMPSRS
jgi:hypothetical protein